MWQGSSNADRSVLAAAAPADAADVHSPGVPRDCAALEGLDEPDLTALAAAAGRSSASGGTSGGRGTADDVGHKAGGSSDAPAVDMDAALSRLQEVSVQGPACGWGYDVCGLRVLSVITAVRILPVSVQAYSVDNMHC
jgi:hypothetical protein